MPGVPAAPVPVHAELAPLVQASRDGAVLRVHVQPGAGSEGLVGLHGNSLKVRVRAPAASGKANEALLRLLSRELGVPRSRLDLTSGAASREKRARFSGTPAADLLERLASALARAAPRSGN